MCIEHNDKTKGYSSMSTEKFEEAVICIYTDLYFETKKDDTSSIKGMC